MSKIELHNNKINKSYTIKRFFMRLFDPLIEDGNNLIDNQKIVIVYADKEKFHKSKGYNNIDDLVLSIVNDKRSLSMNTYFLLSTSESDERKGENCISRTCIGIDFDSFPNGIETNEQKMDYVQGKLKEIGLFYNVLVYSGRGIHCYICLEPTKDLKLVQDVTNKIIELTGADNNANTSAQILRVPCTFNCKNGNRIRVIAKHIEEKDTIKRKDINKLASKLLNRNVKVGNCTIKSSSNCQRVIDLINNGSDENNRHNDMLFIYSKLKQQGITQGQLKLMLDKWNSHDPLEDYEYQLKHLEDNFIPNVRCGDCKYKSQCWHYEEIREQQDTDLLLSSNILKKSKKGAKKNMLSGNELLVYGIIYIQQNVTIEKLIKEFTYKKKETKEIKQCLSERTIRTCLKSMEEKGIVLVAKDGNKNIYSLKKPRRLLEEQKILLSTGALYERIKGEINEAEFQLYCFMKYLQWEQRSLNKINSDFKLKITQKELASLYGISVENCNRYLKKLYDGKYISYADDIKDIHKSSKNGYDYYTYTLNY